MPHGQKDSSQEDTSNRHQARKSTKLLSAIPPQGQVLLAIVSVQVGAAIAKHIFPVLGAEGTVAIRIIFSTLLLSFVTHSAIRRLPAAFIKNWWLLLTFGLCIAAMNLFFYMSIARIPLGTAVAIEFIGPLGVAVMTSRRLSHFAWVSLAAVGILLLSPISGVNLDPLGILFALIAGAGWALFIILAGRVGTHGSGNDGLVIGMIIASVVMIPFAVPVVDELVSNPLILIMSFGVALLSTTLPFTLEFEALKKLPARTYGILVSGEPAVAAIIGVLLLGEYIGLQSIIAIACVVVAAIGITISDGRNQG